MPLSDCAAANAVALTPLRSVTMYSPGIGSPMFRSSARVGTVVDVVVDDDVVVVDDDVVEVDDVLDVDDVVLLDGAVVVVVVDDDVVEVELDDVLDVVEVVLLDGAVVVVVVDDDVVEVELDDVLDVDDVVLLGAAVVVVVVDDVVVVPSSVTPTENVASGSTTNTWGSFFNLFTSEASSSATKPFTLLENTSFTSLPSDSSLFTLAATLADSERMTT